MRERSLFDEPQRAPSSLSFPSARVREAPGFIPLSEVAPDSGPRLTGIARVAANAPEIDERNDVEYRHLACRTLLSPCASRRVPFDYTINPYRGCECGCAYCYARYTHEYMELEDWRDFERKIFVKQGAREALLRDLRRLDLRGKWIAIGTATDPYQPAERRYRLTRSLLETLAGRRNLRLSITTKCDLVTRDLDLLLRIGQHSEVHVNVTVTTPHYPLSRVIEPRAPRPDRRLAAVEALSAAGVKVGVFVMPVLPRINDGYGDLDLLVRLAKEAGAHYLATQVLFLRNSSKKRFFPFIEEQFPELLPYYRRLYAAHETEELRNYTLRKTAEIRQLKVKHGLSGLPREDREPDYVPDQLVLDEQ
jgi:DNA repair photolyase